MNLLLIFKSVLNMSLTGTVVICFVMLTRFFLRNAPKVFSYALWAVVLFRLLCPVSFSSVFSLLHFTKATVSSTEGVVTSVAYAPVLDIYQYIHEPSGSEGELPEIHNETPDTHMNLSIPENRTEVTPTPDAESQQAPAEPVRDPIYYAVTIWLVGMGAMLLYSVYSYRKLGKKIVGAVRLRNHIYLADHIPSPFVMGVLRPKIYLPSALDPSERKYIIAHERYHIRRKDHIIKLLSYGALCLHWFNPMVWVAFTLSGKDMEMSCDEAVIGRLGPKIRADYSASLLRLATGHRSIALTPLAFGEGDTKGRVMNMAKWKKPKFWVIICAAIVCIGVLVACATNPAEENPQADPTEPTITSIETQANLMSEEIDPVNACQQAIDDLIALESYYIQYDYEFTDDSFQRNGNMKYRRHGNDLLIDNEEDRLAGSTIYFNGVYGTHYGDYWAMDEEESEFDPNAWLSRWAPEGKQISNASLDNSSTIVYDAVWPHQLTNALEYHGQFTYYFGADGSLAMVEREYTLMENGEKVSTSTDRLTIMEEDPKDTYAAIKAVADQCISISELDAYRQSKNVVTGIPSNSTEFDKDFELGAGQMRWNFFGNSWQFAFGAEDFTPTSVTLVHKESSDHHSSLTADEGFWLEELVNGKWQYVNAAMTKAALEKVSITVSGTLTDRYTIDWTDSYGELEPGFYRVGRYYTVTLNSGETETNVCYAKFRIMDEKMEELLKKCKIAFDTLLSSSYYHVYATDWMTQHEHSYYMTTETWKEGSNYLSDTRYINKENPDVLEARKGGLMRNGARFDLEWSDDSVTSPIASWQSNTYMEESTFQIWTYPFEWFYSRVEDVIQHDNQISIIETYDFNGKYENTEITLTFDAEGNLTAMTQAYLPTRDCAEKDKVIELEMVVQDTAAAEIASIINNQDLSQPMTFSYAQDVTDNPDAQTSGFINTAAQTISSMEDALNLAAEECTLDPQVGLYDEGYNMTKVYYDSDAKMWKVEFLYSASDEVYQAVYLDAQGITKMIVTK